ncbi:uncharacterized protein [Leptinotarsa decemlineata]|uniref:uncharacterized protein n=1 Tax=Leptinotarsa decemlineata TaxID=7539 RepID=UPI003D30AD35
MNYHLKTQATENIMRITSFALLRANIHDARRQLNETDTQRLRLHTTLSNIIHPLIWDKIDTLAEFRAEKDFNITTEKQKDKFNSLSLTQTRKNNIPRIEATRVVYNCSSKHLVEASTEALAKGFNFAVAPGRIPVENIISNVESALNRIDDKETQESIGQDIAHVLKNTKPPTRNKLHKEYQALKNLRENEDIIILPADKGNATVVLNTIDYESKMMKLLEDPAYKKIVRDLTTYLEKTTKTAINNSPIDDKIKRHLIPREKSSKCPKLYGLPNVHKEGAPLRPIVSSVGSPVHQLAKHVAHVLQPHAEKVDSYVRNADHLIDILKTQTVSPDDILVSFDITSLFTQAPTGEALEIIKKKYKPEEHIITLAEYCIKNTYFIYNDQRYRQIEGAPMGSPLSPVVANLFMEEIETEAIATSHLKPKLWLRYVDDIFVIWSHGHQELSRCLIT